MFVALLLLSYCLPVRLFERRGQRPQEGEEELAKKVGEGPIIAAILLLLLLLPLLLLLRLLLRLI
jgi:hypothetical protein